MPIKLKGKQIGPQLMSECHRSAVQYEIAHAQVHTHPGSSREEVWRSCGVTRGLCHLGGSYCVWLRFQRKQEPFTSPRLSFQLLSWKCALNLQDSSPVLQGRGVCVCVCVAIGNFYWNCKAISLFWQTQRNAQIAQFFFFPFPTCNECLCCYVFQLFFCHV